MSRRRFVADAGLAGLAMMPWTSRGSNAAVPLRGPKGPLMFNAYRNGSPLGFHRIDFSEADERLIVDIEIVFDVKLAFIPVYRYRHRNREVWEGWQAGLADVEDRRQWRGLRGGGRSGRAIV